MCVDSVERSTDQVRKPLYLDALTSWFGKFPTDVESELPVLAPMLERLGYDPRNMRPSYGTPDEFVLNKARKLKLAFLLYWLKWAAVAGLCGYQLLHRFICSHSLSSFSSSLSPPESKLGDDDDM